MEKRLVFNCDIASGLRKPVALALVSDFNSGFRESGLDVVLTEFFERDMLLSPAER